MARKSIEIDYDAFRDSIGTVDKDGKRKWVYPRKPSGKNHNRRAIVAAILLIGMVVGPFLKWDGHPMFLMDFIHRKYILFGFPFMPQDFFLLALALITFFVGVILFTSLFGRFWCGWTCPQTVFMEMVFRKIEYFIEGDAPKQKKLDRQKWDQEKILKKGSKWLIFYAISFFVANILMAYIFGVDEVFKMMAEGPASNFGLFGFIVAFSAVFFFLFAYFREQACIVVCPYGRLQSTLLDQDSIVVHYDHIRGEPRGRYRKGEERETGDCISCNLCVQVCPTAIDIKDGTQMECVNCTACIDVCDEVMDKVGFERGLIRFASFNQIEQGIKKFKFTTRVFAYIGVFTIMLGILGFQLASRSKIDISIEKSRGSSYQLIDEGKTVLNLYTVDVLNKSYDEYSDLEFRLVGIEGEVEMVGGKISLIKEQAQKATQTVFKVKIARDKLGKGRNTIEIGLYQGDILLDTDKTSFPGPRIK